MISETKSMHDQLLPNYSIKKSCLNIPLFRWFTNHVIGSPKVKPPDRFNLQRIAYSVENAIHVTIPNASPIGSMLFRVFIEMLRHKIPAVGSPMLEQENPSIRLA
jgi:hypothetical protein